MAPNQAVQRTRASRFAQRRIQRHRRLAPVADLCVTITASLDARRKQPASYGYPSCPRPPFLNADRFVSSDHDVINQRNADDFRGLFQPLSDTEVLITRRRISGRMIVDG